MPRLIASTIGAADTGSKFIRANLSDRRGLSRIRNRSLESEPIAAPSDRDRRDRYLSRAFVSRILIIASARPSARKVGQAMEGFDGCS
jgi:hypothetical protein